MKPKHLKEYMEGNFACPFCNSENITSQDLPSTDYNIAWQPFECLSCSKEWQDEYRLIAISWIKDGERIYSDEI